MDSKMSFILNIQVYRDTTPFGTVNSKGYFEGAQWLHNIAEDLYLRDNLRDRMYFHHISPGALSRCSLRQSISSNVVILFVIRTNKSEKFNFSRTHVACGSSPCAVSVFSGDHSTADRGRPHAGRPGLCARTAEFDVQLCAAPAVQVSVLQTVNIAVALFRHDVVCRNKAHVRSATTTIRNYEHRGSWGNARGQNDPPTFFFFFS